MNPRIFIGILAVIAVLSIIIGIFRGGGGSDSTLPASELVLTDMAESSAAVSLEMQGEITAPEEHYRIKVQVTNTDRIIRVEKGYDGRVIRSKRYNNTVNSYDNFLHALNGVGFLKEREGINVDDFVITGSCQFGERHIYRVNRLGANLKTTWTTTCSSSDGTSAGNRSSIERLFEAQIPDYRDITSGISL